MEIKEAKERISMDVEEVKRKRSILENNILNLVLEFENETGTSVEYIRIDKEAIIGKRLQKTFGVSIKLEM